MICHPCRADHHADCPGGTWCDCQHQRRDGSGDAEEVIVHRTIEEALDVKSWLAERDLDQPEEEKP